MLNTKTELPIQRCLNGEGVEELSDVELIAVLLGTGSKTKNVMECAYAVFSEFKSIYGIYHAGLRELASCSGLGVVKAMRIKVAIELGKRLIAPRCYEETVNSPKHVWESIVNNIAGSKHEEFWVLILDSKNRLIKKKRVSMGTITEALVHPREIYRDAIRESASSIIIVHNHPSGMLTPSNNDIDITKRVAQAGSIVGIQLLDHVIVTDNDYLSLRETDETLFA